MKILFIFNSEVERRAVNPVIGVFLSNGIECKILKTNFCNHLMKVNENNFIDEARAKELTWNFIISSNPIKKGEFNGKRVVIHHGSMFGNNSWSLKSASHADIYFGLSPYELGYIKHYLKTNFDQVNFIASGNPANDHLLKFSNFDGAQKDAMKIEMGLKQQRTILLSSHWTSLGNFRKFGTGLLDALIWNFPNHQIICTCHPLLLKNPKKEFRLDTISLTPHFDSEWLIASFKSLAKKNNNIKIIFDKVDLAKLLFISDIFVGDNSSLLAEASFFNIPLFANIEGSYFDQTVSKIIAEDVYKFKNIEELIGGIKNLDNCNLHHTKNGSNIKKLFMFNTGHAAKTIFETLTSKPYF